MTHIKLLNTFDVDMIMKFDKDYGNFVPPVEEEIRSECFDVLSDHFTNYLNDKAEIVDFDYKVVERSSNQEHYNLKIIFDRVCLDFI